MVENSMPTLKLLFVVAPANLQKKGPLGWYCAQIQPYIDIFQREGHTVAMSFSPNFGGIRVRRAHRTNDPRFYALTFFIWKQLGQVLGLGALSKHRFFSLDRLRADWFEARKAAIGRVIAKEQPDAVLGINLSETEFQVARDCGLSTVEFQHCHYFPNLSRKLFPESKPDYFAHWFLEDSEEIRKDGLTPIHVGSPFSVKIPSSSERSTLLIALQYGHKNSVDSFGMADQGLECFLRFDWSSQGLRPLVRFHPASSRPAQICAMIQMKCKFSRLQFSTSWGSDLDEILDKSAGVVSHSSSIWVDAASKGLPSFSIMPLSAAERASPSFKRLVSVAQGPNELLKRLRMLENQPREHPHEKPTVQALTRALL